MKGLIGKKVGMTSIFTEAGNLVPVTVVEATPNYITQVKTEETDGYNAHQFAFSPKPKNVTKALAGHFSKAGVDPMAKVVEFRDVDEASLDGKTVGDSINVELFEVGTKVNVVGTSKGKGFQGVVKRHNFRGVGGQTHGQHNRGRAPGSIGAASTPSRVMKGMKMAGELRKLT